MITLNKSLKIRLLRSIKSGVFSGEQFPELQQELGKFSIELIDNPSQVEPDGQLRNDNCHENTDN